jgi:hypothetical protein
LGCIEELAAFFALDGPDEDAVRDAGEEVANAVGPGEHGHGIAIGSGGGHGSEELVGAVFSFDGLHVVVEGALPRGAAAPERGFGTGASGPGRDSGAGIERSGRRDVRESPIESALFEGFSRHGGFSCE